MSGTLRAKILRIREREQYMLREVKTLRGRCRYARTKTSPYEHIGPRRRKVVLMLCVFEKGDSKRAAMIFDTIHEKHPVWSVRTCGHARASGYSLFGCGGSRVSFHRGKQFISSLEG